MFIQDVKVFMKYHNSDPESNACEDCIFQDTCCESQELQYILGKCSQGDYWEVRT